MTARIAQANNLYAYVICNPMKYIDPLGNDAWLVHGTTGILKAADDGTGLGHWNDTFVNYLSSLFSQSIHYCFEWDGRNARQHRLSGAELLVSAIIDVHGTNPFLINEPIRLIGYSHGGNVAIQAANMLAENYGIYVDTLITIATPIRADNVLAAQVGQHINVYNRGDSVQTFGGIDSFWQGNFRLLRARRTKEGAVNIPVVTDINSWRRVYNHGIMHSNTEIWEYYIEPRLELSYMSVLNGCICSMHSLIFMNHLLALDKP